MVLPPSSFFTGNRAQEGSQSRVSRSPDETRARENVVVSSLEMRNLFQSIKELSTAVKTQNDKVDKMGQNISSMQAEIQAMTASMEEIRAEISLVKETADPASNPHYGPVPKAVKVR